MALSPLEITIQRLQELVRGVIHGEKSPGGYPLYSKSVSFDCSHWHGGPNCAVAFVPGYGGIGVKIICVTCKVLSDVEAVGYRIVPASSHETVQTQEETP